MRSTIISIFLLLCFFNLLVISTDTLTKFDSLSTQKTLISKGGKFELGFFTKGNPKRYYVGIWYTNIPTQDNNIVWVANRDSPCHSKSCMFKLGDNSIILFLDGGLNITWQSQNFSGKSPIIQLLDSGNLVVREAGDLNSNNFIWESFDYPTDTIIAGQKIGRNLKKGLDRYLSSWISLDDPGTGNITFKMDYHGYPEIYCTKEDQIIYRSGPWIGQRFSGVPEMHLGDKMGINFTFYNSLNEIYYAFELPIDTKIKTGFTVTFEGVLVRWFWPQGSIESSKFKYNTLDQCDNYRACAPYQVCNPNGYLPTCECPNGFKSKDVISAKSTPNGCVRKNKLNCSSDGFSLLDNIKLPETTTAYVDKNLNLNQCRDLCKRNCSCTAYTNSQFVGGRGSGCVIWTDNLTDMRYMVNNNGQPLYMRLAFSDLANATTPSPISKTTGELFPRPHKAKHVTMGIRISIAVAIVLVGLAMLLLWKRKNTKNSNLRVAMDDSGERSQEILLSGQLIHNIREYSGEANDVDEQELPFFDVYSMAIATDKFSDTNKLGQGGFGGVYKGVMPDGKEVAVKRLSKESRQGAEEFKNEIRLIAKLQHRNLVRLLGCCVEQDEKMLIYEYLENRSLDSIIFYKDRCSLLNWPTRFNIICGIARGLLYLHQDSRYRIIHRDLKASNVLLDKDMNPKISDFGMARIFGGDETEEYTMKVVGTYGYMAPEYALDGLFSIKSDVFSFGVLVLEILSGMKNKGFYNSENDQTFLGYLWKQWKEGNETEVIDKSMGDVYSKHEVLTCLQVGLLCVQERPEDRPTMTLVVPMLTSLFTTLPRPKLPGFCIRWKLNANETDCKKKDESFTVNQVTISTLHSR